MGGVFDLLRFYVTLEPASCVTVRSCEVISNVEFGRNVRIGRSGEIRMLAVPRSGYYNTRQK